jgi:hypothetical protein
MQVTNKILFLEILEIRPPQIKYSKYAVNLDRLFKNHSLETLQFKIKNPVHQRGEHVILATKNQNILNKM